MTQAVCALQLRAFGDPSDSVILVETPLPRLQPAELLIELEAASINPSDLRLIAGEYGVRPPLPAPLGAEGVGRVVDIGPGAESALAGRRVLIIPGHEHGTWATRAVVKQANVVAVDEAADPLQLAMAGVNPVTALLLLRSGADIGPGEWIAQTGANSAVGQYLVRLARRAGAKTFNVVRRPEAARVVSDAGGDVVFVYEGSISELRDALGEREFALVLDSVGGPVITELTQHLRRGGKVVSFGAISGKTVVLAVRDDLIYRDIRHHGFWIVNWLRDASRDQIEATYREVVELVVAGALSATVDRTYRLDQYREALVYAQAYRRSGKLLFTFGSDGRAVASSEPAR